MEGVTVVGWYRPIGSAAVSHEFWCRDTAEALWTIRNLTAAGWERAYIK